MGAGWPGGLWKLITASLAPMVVPIGMFRVPVTVVVEARVGDESAIPPIVAVLMGAPVGGSGAPPTDCMVMVTT